MRTENAKMKKLLKDNGIVANVKYIRDGSLKRTWCIFNKNIRLWDNIELQTKLMSLGFVDSDYGPITNVSGNGGLFSCFLRYREDVVSFVDGDYVL